MSLRDAIDCYEHIKTDKTEQNESFNQFAMHVSKYFA